MLIYYFFVFLSSLNFKFGYFKIKNKKEEIRVNLPILGRTKLGKNVINSINESKKSTK